MNANFILNDPLYGSERSHNGLRLAVALVKQDQNNTITIFLMADAVTCAKNGQKTPDGYYNVERILKRFTLGNHRILLCGTCMDARGLTQAELVEGARRSTMEELAQITMTADKVLVF
jgi:uncharacterized protein involved in oxidation of intracellular sulfur